MKNSNQIIKDNQSKTSSKVNSDFTNYKTLHSTLTQQQVQQYDNPHYQNYSTKTGLNYRLFSIPQFYQILQDQKYNQFDVILQSYELKKYQHKFRQTIVHFLTKQYYTYGVADFVDIESILFQKNTLIFLIHKSKKSHLTLFKKAFTPNDSLLQKPQTLQQLHNTRNQQLDKLQKQKHQYLLKNQILQEKEPQTHKNIKSKVEERIKSKLELKVILIKFYWRLIEQKRKQIINYKQNHLQQPLVFQHIQYQKIINMNNTKIDIRNQSVYKNKSITLIQELSDMQNDVFEALKSYSSQLSLLMKIYEELKRQTEINKEMEMKQLNRNADVILQCMKTFYFLLKQKAKITSKQTKYINFLFSLDDVMQLMSEVSQQVSCEELNSYQLKCFLRYLFEQNHQSVFILHNFIQSTFFKIDYVSFVQQNLTQIDTKKYMENTYRRQLTANQIESDCKRLFESIILHNYAIVSNQFSKKQPFNSNLYLSPRQSAQVQKMIKKIIFLDKSSKNISFIKRVYLESTLDFKQLKNINAQKSTFGFQSIYKFYADIDWISQKARYLIHFSQYLYEILTELSQNTTLSLTLVFNSVRFFVCFFLSHFWIQSVNKIFQEIRQKNGYFYFNVLYSILNRNQRWKSSQNKIFEVLKLTEKRLIKYDQDVPKVSQSENKKAVNNSEKFHKMCKQNETIKQTFYALKNKSQLSLEELFKQPYNFKTVKNLYNSILILCFSEYGNKQVLRKNYERKVLPITQAQIKEVKKNNFHKKDFQNYLLFISTNKKQLDFDLFTSPNSPKQQLKHHQQYQFICQKFILYYIETLKIVSMILSVPYYSFQNEIENLKRKQKKNNEHQKLNENILSSLDQFYIVEGKRVNSTYIAHIIYNSKAQTFFDQYSSSTTQLFQFLLNDKVNKLNQVLDPDFIKDWFLYPQFIHTDRCSIFTPDQSQQYFFKLPKDVIQKIQEFYQFVKAFNIKGSSVLRAFTANVSGTSQIKSNKEKYKKYASRKMEEH